MRRANFFAATGLMLLFGLVAFSYFHYVGPPWSARARFLDEMTHSGLCDRVESALSTRAKKGAFPKTVRTYVSDPALKPIGYKVISKDEIEVTAEFNYGSDVLVRYRGPKAVGIPFKPGVNTFRFKHGDEPPRHTQYYWDH